MKCVVPNRVLLLAGSVHSSHSLSCSSRSPVLSDISTLARSANIPDITFQTLALSQSVDVEYWYKIAGFFQLIPSLGM